MTLIRSFVGRAAVAVPFVGLTSPAFAQPIVGTLPEDLTAWAMFTHADIVVKAVNVGLTIASVVTWTILLAKSLELSRAMREQRLAWKALDQARSLTQAAKQIGDGNGASALVSAAQAELQLSLHSGPPRRREGARGLAPGILDAAAGRRMLKGTDVLATIGATAPFGLFGTVWGIMNSFIGISKAQTTSLAVVAPGIAEALLATALGLAAAIPAVVIYNHFSR